MDSPGALRPEFRVCDPFLVSSASLWRGEAEDLALQQALALRKVYEHHGKSHLAAVGGRRSVRRARILTVNNFVNTAQEKCRLGAAGYDLVDMEFAAVALSAEESGLPLTGLKVVSDTLLHDFPSFRFSGSGKSRGWPPPRLVVNSMRACRVLGRFAFSWLKAVLLDEPGDRWMPPYDI